MNAKDALKSALNSNHDILKMYLGDLTDADLLVRPVPNANHAAWQIGHLIVSEVQLLSAIPGTTPTPLPGGFAEKHAKETATIDSASAFLKKNEYLDLLEKVRAGTLAALEKLPEAEFDKPTSGRVADYAPTYGAVFLAMASHTMMHAGQFTVLRRKLGKPVLF